MLPEAASSSLISLSKARPISFSPRGARDNVELLQFLTGEGYAVEYLQAAPWMHVDDYNAGLSAKSLLIVARNRP